LKRTGTALRVGTQQGAFSLQGIGPLLLVVPLLALVLLGGKRKALRESCTADHEERRSNQTLRFKCKFIHKSHLIPPGDPATQYNRIYLRSWRRSLVELPLLKSADKVPKLRPKTKLRIAANCHSNVASWPSPARNARFPGIFPYADGFAVVVPTPPENCRKRPWGRILAHEASR
jgi:hypothetical protein